MPPISPNPPAAKRIAIVQSNYIPWKGYFDLVNLVDEFVLLDDVQYTRRDWRNRNRIKTRHGPRWLTVPVAVKKKYHQRICETRISDPGWAVRHWRSLQASYARAPCFHYYKERFQSLYLECREELLTAVNYRFLKEACHLLGIDTRLTFSMDYEHEGAGTERLVSICRAAGATEYLSGPAARAYLEESLFAQAGIQVRWMDYSGYREHRQLFPPFDHQVSILDLLFNEGDDARHYMKSFETVALGSNEAES